MPQTRRHLIGIGLILTLKGLLNPIREKIQAEVQQWLGQDAQ
ncbi:MAG: hypothetical protein NTZ09_12620 [Candidatus Hydrogenedentes bacterium]|nr:hypothetical protein [Candidatus Hydrogenedentota bacterium]